MTRVKSRDVEETNLVSEETTKFEQKAYSKPPLKGVDNEAFQDEIISNKEKAIDQEMEFSYVETSKVIGTNLPVKLSFESFISRYKMLVFSQTAEIEPTADHCKLIIQRAGIKDYQFHENQVHLGYVDAVKLNQLCRDQDKKIVRAQATIRGYLARSRSKKELTESSTYAKMLDPMELMKTHFDKFVDSSPASTISAGSGRSSKSRKEMEENVFNALKKDDKKYNAELKKVIQNLDRNTDLKANRDLSAELASVRSSYLQTLQQVANIEQSKSKLQSQQQVTEQQRCWLQVEVERLLQENISIKRAIENSFSKTDYDRLQDEHRKLQTEHGNLKHEYNLLNYKHQDYIITHKKEKEAAEKESQEIIVLRKERDSLMKQVTMLQDKLALVEESKKQAEMQIKKLKTELTEATAVMKQNNSSRENILEERQSLRREVDMLKQQIEKVKEKELLQEKMLTNLKKEHMESTNSEIDNLKRKLQEMMEATKKKEQIIEKLNTQLKSSNELVQAKEHEIQELLKTIKNLEEERQALLQDIQMLRELLEAELSQKQELQKILSAQSLQEELSKAERSDMDDQIRSLDLRSSSEPLSNDPSKTQQKGQYGGWFFVLPEKSEAEGGNRLQNLISKYRSHSENEMESLRLAGKPLAGNVSPQLVSKSRFSDASNKPFMDKSFAGIPAEAHRSQPAVQEKGSSTSVKYSRSTTNPMSPASVARQFPSTKSSFMQTVTNDGGKKRETPSFSSTTSMSSSVRRMLPSVVSGKTTT